MAAFFLVRLVFFLALSSLDEDDELLSLSLELLSELLLPDEDDEEEDDELLLPLLELLLLLLESLSSSLALLKNKVVQIRSFLRVKGSRSLTPSSWPPPRPGVASCSTWRRHCPRLFSSPDADGRPRRPSPTRARASAPPGAS